MKMPRVAYHMLPEGSIPPTVTVYGAGVRIWHWLNALLVFILCFTGYFIGTPWPSSIGDTSILYSMGWLRFFHLASGYLFALLALYRFALVFTEGGITHHLFLPAIWRREWIIGFNRQILWNIFLGRPQRYVGLNPLGGIIMLLLYVLPGALLILSGFAMYAEVTGHDSWQYFLFGWVGLFFGNTLDLHVVHRLSMWLVVWFIGMHVYVAVREDITSRQTVISTMLSGERQFRK
jgi:Ni/Fe-hydrogenase 1 B-type cytochrome subunit